MDRWILGDQQVNHCRSDGFLSGKSLRLVLVLACLAPPTVCAQGFREAPRAPAAGAIAPIQAPNSGPRTLEAQTSGAAGSGAASAQLPAGPVKAPSADMSVEEMIKALAGGTSGPSGVGDGAGSASSGKGAGSGPNAPGAINQGVQDPGKPGSIQAAAPGIKADGAMVDLTIQFAFDSATILDESKALLDRLAKALNAAQLQSLKFVVEGHTDGVGNKAYNDQLSARRAQSVVDYLVKAGVSASRLRSTGRGFAELLYPQDPKAAGNRRVRIKVGV